MRKFTKAALAVPAVTALAFAAPAFAAGPYTVSVGGDSSAGDVAFEGTATPIDFVAHSQITDVYMDCAQSVATGDIHTGTNMSGSVPEHPATITDSDWSNCLGPLTLDMTVEQVGDWHLEVDGSASGNVVEGRIVDVEAHVYATNDPTSCAFTVSGAVDGSFDKAAQELTVAEDGLNPNGHDLTITLDSSSSGCGGLISTGDAASFDGVYAIDTLGAGPVDITG